MELALVNYFDMRRYIIVPNIRRGLRIHEVDLLIVNDLFYATEVEIKISKADLIKDLKKKHQHKSTKIKNLFFAIPRSLEPYIEYIPINAGIIIVDFANDISSCSIIRRCKPYSRARKLTQIEINKLLKLGIMRVWRLKEKLNNLKKL
jgi:hypothetical protein